MRLFCWQITSEMYVQCELEAASTDNMPKNSNSFSKEFKTELFKRILQAAGINTLRSRMDSKHFENGAF